MQESTHVAICALLNELVRAPAVNINGLFSTPVHRNTSNSPRGEKS
jgi:hypothetical protein